MFQKTDKMKIIEMMEGGTLEEVVPRLYRELGTLEALAERWNMSVSTFYTWFPHLHLKIRTVIEYDPPGEQP